MKKLFGTLIIALLYCNVMFAAVDPPGSFTASNPTDNTIDVAWTFNAKKNLIMIATNTGSEISSTPANGNVYPIGSLLPGGGGVIYYSTNNLSGTLTGLLQNTTYYLQSWSIKSPSPNASQYSAPSLKTNETTTPEPGVIMGLVFAGLAMMRARKQ